MVPLVGAVPSVLLGVKVKVAGTPTVNEPLPATLLNCRSGARMAVITVLDVLLPAPVRPGSSGSVTPTGTIAVALLATVPL